MTGLVTGQESPPTLNVIPPLHKHTDISTDNSCQLAFCAATAAVHLLRKRNHSASGRRVNDRVLKAYLWSTVGVFGTVRVWICTQICVMCKRVGVWRQSGKCVFVCECVYIVELTVFHFLLFREHFLPFFPQLKHQQSYYVGWFIPPLSPSLPSSHCRIWTAGQKANDVVFFVFFPTNLELHQSIVFYWRWHIVFFFVMLVFSAHYWSRLFQLHTRQ